MHKALLFVVGLAAAVLAGCLEGQERFSLNPDGSGKVVMDLVIREPRPGPSGSNTEPPMVRAKQVVRSLVDFSRGVDAWADVTFGVAEDGAVRFKGTAYFKDLGQFQVARVSIPGMSFTKDEKGGMALVIDPAAEMAREKGRAPAAPPPKMTEEELDAATKQAREKFERERTRMEQVLTKTRIDLSFQLPGAAADVSQFKKDADGTVRIVFEGPKLLAAMDQLMKDEAAMRDFARADREVEMRRPFMDKVLEKVLGSKAPIRARVTGDLKPVFDYEAEAKAARENYPKMREQLGLEPVRPAPAMPAPPGVP